VVHVIRFGRFRPRIRASIQLAAIEQHLGEAQIVPNVEEACPRGKLLVLGRRIVVSTSMRSL